MRVLDFPPGFDRPPRAPLPERIQAGYARWQDAVSALDDGSLASFAAAAWSDADSRLLLETIFCHSPFLTQCLVKDPAFLKRLFEQGPNVTFESVLEGLRSGGGEPIDDAGLARLLRIAKRQTALAVAVADISGVWELERVTGALSDFAAVAIGRAARQALKNAARAGAFSLAHPEDPETDSGLVVIGMGKLGAGELNYSSDVDLVVLFDAERVRTDNPGALQGQFVRLTRAMLRFLDERTADGYVFRTDLRLRPDPGATPIALSTLAAEGYYESLGQNWERAAMIKARAVAGDMAAGAAFLDHLRPFIWRKNLDFAAIQDIHSIKRQINAHRGGEAIAVFGHNIKLGRGGIREIEFFAQTQQLIWGGREPGLRRSGTIEALAALVEAERVGPETTADLSRAYRFLRHLEHRLQMVEDEQTHSLPRHPEGLANLAAFLGYTDDRAFTDELLGHLRRVEAHYAALFEESPDLSASGRATGNLVFTGGEPDPETLETIGGLGFENRLAVDSTVRGWHHGRYRAMRSTRARELLTELMPTLLSALGNTPDPDAAFAKFDEFLSRLPSGVQLFSMFYANPQLLGLVAEIMGAAPRLAEHLSHRPNILEGVLSPDFFDPPLPAEELERDLDRHLAQARNFEDVLDLGRRWANDRRFQVGVQCLRDLLRPRDAALALSNVADIAVAGLLPRVEAEFARQHGRVPGAAMAILAMGKMGGREMTPTSDLDLIFIYDAPDGTTTSDGPRSLPVSQYFARLSQRLINAVTARTAEGVLYEVDMRLRPSGNAGPIASSIEAFRRYQQESAWTWEHMALTRARFLAGPADLGRRIEAVIRETLTRPRDPHRLLRDVAAMRARMAHEHASDFILEIKHMRGGLVDIEFLTQYLLLRHGRDHPEIFRTNTREALVSIRDSGLVAEGVVGDLVQAMDLWQALLGMLRLTIDGTFRNEREKEVSEGLRETLMRRGGDTSFAGLMARIERSARTVHGHFVRLIEKPAGTLPAAIVAEEPGPAFAAVASRGEA